MGAVGGGGETGDKEFWGRGKPGGAAVPGRREEVCDHPQLPDPAPGTRPGASPYPRRLSGRGSGPSAASQPGTSRAPAAGSRDSLPAPVGGTQATPPPRRVGERRGGARSPAGGPSPLPTVLSLPGERNPAVPSGFAQRTKSRSCLGSLRRVSGRDQLV